MKQIPAQLLTTLKKPGRSTCFLVKIVSPFDGSVYAFTTLDDKVRFNDGIHDVLYLPDQELRPQNIQNSTAMQDADNTELHGWFSAAVEQAVLAGRLASAEITIYRVSYLRLSAGAEVVAYGTVGRIDYAANKQGRRKIEYQGLDQIIQQKQNDLYSLTCRHDFGDENCGMPLVWEEATIVQVEDQFARVRLDGLSRPNGWFDLGVVLFADGDNIAATLEVESWTTDGWINLSFVTPYPMTESTSVFIRRDCDKTAIMCKAYGNIVNMGAEHLTPVQEQSLMVPGAYIKSSNAL